MSASSQGSAESAGEWAKTVADGAVGADPPPAAPLGNVTPDDVLDAAAAEPETEVINASDVEIIEEEAGADVDEDDGVDVVDAELVDEVAEDGPPLPPPAPVGDDAEVDDGTGFDGTGSDDVSVEDLVVDLERVTSERDQYLDASRRLQAEFENYKKQVGKREATARERANDSLISELLPVMDAFDGAIANGAEDVAPMRTSFLDALAKQGLERIDPTDGVFDPNLHEAVMHEDAADVDGPVVAEVMRAGYAWKGRVLRPAMVRTKG